MKRTLHNFRARAYQWLLFEAGWSGTPAQLLLATINRHGITFPHNGDEVWWLWPWKRGKLPDKPFISVGFTGTGEWGDSRWATLKEMDAEWDAYFKACEESEAWDVTLMDGLDGAPVPVTIADLTENLNTPTI